MLTQILSHDLSYALAWTLVHSMWQISLVAAILAVIMKVTKHNSAESRYLISFATLAVIGICSLVTFAIYYNASQLSPQTVIAGFAGELTTTAQLSTKGILAFIDSYFFIIVNTWLLGTVLFLVKLIAGYTWIKRITKTAVLDNAVLNKKLTRLKAKFRIHRTITLKQSNRITTPMVVGFVKPIILFPLGLVNQLSGEEVSAILAHELAHIKRHDFLFNLIQSLAEAVFYYHPGIWYISTTISKEREHCCDDLAIKHSVGKVSYAKTLVRLQELKLETIQPAVAMAGRRGTFTQRIHRILDQPVQSSQFKEKLVAALLISVTMMGFAKDNYLEQPVDIDNLDVYIIDDCPADINEIKYYVDTKKHQRQERRTKDGRWTDSRT